jgi:hypothetical protein
MFAGKARGHLSIEHSERQGEAPSGLASGGGDVSPSKIWTRNETNIFAV